MLSDGEEDLASDASMEEEESDLESPQKRIKLEGNEESKITNKTSKSDLKKPPTAEELQQLKQTENLFNSNLFKLQIQSLITEVKLKQKHKNALHMWLANLKSFLKSMQESEILLSQIGVQKEFAGYHMCPIRTDQDVPLKFFRPDFAYSFGMYLFDAKIDQIIDVDIVVGMPKKSFLQRDFLNNRYLVKRFYYASYIYHNLSKSGMCSTINFIDDDLQPVLEITPTDNENIRVKLRAIASNDTFKLNRFLPDKNNLKVALFDNVSQLEPILKDTPTPYLNCNILSDLVIKSNYELIEITLKKFPNVQEALILLSVWLKQRGLHAGNQGFTNLLLENVVVYLVLKKKINKLMSSYQVIRHVWTYMSTSNWHSEPASMCEDTKPDVIENFKTSFELVFLDHNGMYNLAALLDLNVYVKIRREAELAIKYLDDSSIDSFNALFITKITPELQYDAIIRLNDVDFNFFYKTNSDADKCKYVGCYQVLAMKTIVEQLKRALGRRIMQLVPVFRDNTSTNLEIGLILNSFEAFNKIEKGPESNTYEAIEFRKFWGELSECRRFGTVIQEAVYFECNTMKERRGILRKILDFVIKEKLQVDKYEIFYDQIEDVISYENVLTPFPCGTNEESTSNCIKIFDELSKVLRYLPLQLEIKLVQGSCSVFSHTELFPPIPTCSNHLKDSVHYKKPNFLLTEALTIVPRYSQPLECVIQLGTNSKWPNDLKAIHQIKIAFYLKIAELLPTKLKCVSNVKPDHLDVFYKGLLFRFRIFQPKEHTYLRKYLKPDGMTAFKDTEESITYEKELLILPKIVAALNGIHFQFVSYGPSSALIKRWLRSQMLDESHISDVAIDLINASLFLHVAPYEAPNLPQVAFLRFLKFMVEFDWRTSYIVVNFNNEISREDLDAWDKEFRDNREKFPNLCILTPYDKSSLFSKYCTNEVLTRISNLAQPSLEFVCNRVLENNSSIKKLFVPNLKGFDALIYMKSEIIARKQEMVKFDEERQISLKPFKEEKGLTIPVVGFDPVELLLKNLRENYNDIALFFHDSHGGDVIGVLWKPNALEARPFKVTQVGGRKLKGNNLVLNIESIIDDFLIYGAGLITEIKTEAKCYKPS